MAQSLLFGGKFLKLRQRRFALLLGQLVHQGPSPKAESCTKPIPCSSPTFTAKSGLELPTNFGALFVQRIRVVHRRKRLCVSNGLFTLRHVKPPNVTVSARQAHNSFKPRVDATSGHSPASPNHVNGSVRSNTCLLLVFRPWNAKRTAVWMRAVGCSACGPLLAAPEWRLVASADPRDHSRATIWALHWVLLQKALALFFVHGSFLERSGVKTLIGDGDSCGA
jgi:hypothetical protein